MSKTIRVSVRPWLYQGRDGWRLRWTDAAGICRTFFVLNQRDAAYVKRRAKLGKSNPAAGRWAVKV